MDATKPLHPLDLSVCDNAGVSAPLKVLIADDHPLIVLGMRRTLDADDDIEVVGEAHTGAEVLALIERRRPDVVLLDLRMPGSEGTSCIEQITGSWPDVKIVVLSACDDRASIDSALRAGASAYVVKSVAPVDIASVLRQAKCGAVYSAPLPSGGPARAEEPTPSGPMLTEREAAILAAVATGLTTKAISQELWVSAHTVKFHLTNIYRKLGVRNRSGAIRYAVEHALVDVAA